MTDPGHSPVQSGDTLRSDLERLASAVMPFGKFKGRPIAQLPGHYLAWFAREGFPPGELGRLLALMLELDHNGLRSLLDPLRQPSAH
ncbi:DUF3820 family protein [Xanthomonas sp. NCPPB 2632]|jgi:uncharacterized protein (DUF3820 family)|uniref:DUF3820 family protein n=1 Tax=Xanthomonas sp. NCPPB 2632 TaxID=3240912 RepID=UPI0035153F78